MKLFKKTCNINYFAQYIFKKEEESYNLLTRLGWSTIDGKP